MEDGETPRMRKYGERKTTRIMIAAVPHGTAWTGLTKYQADGFLFDWVYIPEFLKATKLRLSPHTHGITGELDIAFFFLQAF